VRRLVTVAGVVFVLAVVWLTFGPEPGDEADALGDRVEELWDAVVPSGPSPDDLPFDLDNENAANILLFVPVAPLVALRWPRRWWVGLPLGVAASAAIELTQMAVATHRSPTWEDLGWNTVGTVVGFVPVAVVVGVQALRRRRAGSR